MRATSLKLGVFTAFTIVVTIGLASVIGNLSFFANTYQVTGVFSDATGVLNGDLVQVAGVNVGKITSFEVDGGRAEVVMEIADDVELPSNVIADIKFRNLLGQRVVSLERPDEPASEMLGDGDTIPVENTRPALDLSLVFNNLRPLIQTTNPEEINTVARAVVKIFKGNEGDLAGILGNVGDVTKTLAARDQRLARLVTNLKDASKVLNNQSSSIRTSLDDFSEFMEAIGEVTPTIDNVVDQLDVAASKFGRILQRNRGNLDQELKDLAVLLEVIDDNLPSVDMVAKNLKEVLLATARSQSYGKWWNLYVVNLCPESGAHGAPVFPTELECSR